ncbi:hypothetical protein [Marinomonas posidonica]|uniref:hypothetical protein n=1 Tax=Marinomonas posidonica TaxID=936476 RepID=UPI003735126B
MNLITSVATTLSQINEIETWKQCSPQLTREQRLECYKIAQRLWLERSYAANKLYINLGVIEELKANDWQPNTIQKQMIWASVIASVDSKTQRNRFNIIKQKLVKKYGWNWYNECYRRVKKAFSARKWIENRSFEPDSAYMGSMFLREVSNEHVIAALKSIPAN